MPPFNHANWHVWQGQSHVIMSDEVMKKLYYFGDWDGAVNWLFLNGYKGVARKLNEHIKQS